MLIVTIVDPQLLDQKEKPMMYTKAFVEIYNWCYRKLVYEIHGIVKFEKYPIPRAKNLLNLSSQQFYKIFKVLQSAHVVPRDAEGNTSYLNNYIN